MTIDLTNPAINLGVCLAVMLFYYGAWLCGKYTFDSGPPRWWQWIPFLCGFFIYVISALMAATALVFCIIKAAYA